MIFWGEKRGIFRYFILLFLSLIIFFTGNILLIISAILFWLFINHQLNRKYRQSINFILIPLFFATFIALNYLTNFNINFFWINWSELLHWSWLGTGANQFFFDYFQNPSTIYNFIQENSQENLNFSSLVIWWREFGIISIFLFYFLYQIIFKNIIHHRNILFLFFIISFLFSDMWSNENGIILGSLLLSSFQILKNKEQ